MINANPDMINWDLYEIHPNGTIWSHAVGRPLEGWTDCNGDKLVELQMQVFGSEKFRVSRLVARKYVDNYENLTEVRHIDGCKSNNSWRNLEWVEKGSEKRGVKNKNSRFLKEDILKIRRLSEIGVHQKEIAEQYGTNQPYISLVVRKKVWAHL